MNEIKIKAINCYFSNTIDTISLKIFNERLSVIFNFLYGKLTLNEFRAKSQNHDKTNNGFHFFLLRSLKIQLLSSFQI